MNDIIKYDLNMNTVKDNNKILLIHLGGLGDMCLSESTFLSLSEHFGKNIEALGYTRFLKLFEEYFAQINRIESVKWLHLFSDYPLDIIYKQIIFIGKDREGILRQRWRKFSREPVIFIEMYPENQFISDSSSQIINENKDLPAAMSNESKPDIIHVEDYQLAQLGQYGIKAIKKQIKPALSRRVVLYPETGFQKRKWPLENFIELYELLKAKDMEVCILEPLGMNLDIRNKVSLQELPDVASFFKEGGVFFSNDSGMAHLAGINGLFTITIFIDFEPLMWHPRGRFHAFKKDRDIINIPVIENKIIEITAQYS